MAGPAHPQLFGPFWSFQLIEGTTAPFVRVTRRHEEDTESLPVELHHLHRSPRQPFIPVACGFFSPLAGLLLGLSWRHPTSPFGQGSWWCAFRQQSTRWASGTARDYRSAETKAKAASYGSNWKGLSLSTLFPCGRVNISCC